MNGPGKPEAGAIYRGEVVHARVHPVSHKLRYSVFTLALDVAGLKKTAANLGLFSLDGFNLFSLSQRQHGYRDERSIADFVADQVRAEGLEGQVVRTVMLFYPRIFGFAFNPLTVYFCLDENDAPLLMIYEVRNTFGEDLTYVLPAGPEHAGVWSHATAKAFYVSPFNNVEGDYTFHVRPPQDELTVGVALTKDRPILRTHFRGRRSKLSDTALFKMFLAYPAMTAKVVAGIHWEALKLWRKGLSLKDRPPAPETRILR
jgi:DUF1365 family protein